MVLCVANPAGLSVNIWYFDFILVRCEQELGDRKICILNSSLMNVFIQEGISGDPPVLPLRQIFCQNYHQVPEGPTMETCTRIEKYINLNDLGDWTNDVLCWTVEALC